MALKSGFFNSLNGDRRYNADDMSEYFNGLVSNGVYENVGAGMVVTASDNGLSVNVASGRAIIDCKWLKNDSVYNVVLNPASTTYARITAVIIQLDNENRNMAITTVDGVPAASNPEPPSVPDNSLILAYVLVPANAVNVIQSNITDTRADSSVCGWVTGLIEQVDTATLFLQWQSAYEQQFEEFKLAYDEWFEHLTQDLNVDTYVDQYVKDVILDGESSVIALDMAGYTYNEADIINVYVNGLMCMADIDYFIDTTQNPVEIQVNAVADGTEIHISVLKSKIGFNT